MREFLSRHLFSPLQGMTAGVWWSLLRRNRFAIDLPFLARAAFQTANCPANSALARLEDVTYGRKVDAATVQPPLFILGHFRSGTTHLHNLLAQDPQFAFPTLYQTLYPRSFLLTESIVPRLGQFLLLRKRPHDGVALDFGVPNEDEMGLLNASGISPYLAWGFPRDAAFYDRFLTFRDVTGEELARWRASLLLFLKKLTFRYDRPLVLKSPPHTARIGLLLGLFPEARFVHIRRDPLVVFRSTRHMYAATMRYWRLQRSAFDADDRIIAVYREMYDAFLDQKPSIAAGRFHEVAYEELVSDPIGQVASIYEALGLPGFEQARQRMRDYLGTITDYRRNVHPDLPEGLRRRISTEWRRCFEAWGYPD